MPADPTLSDGDKRILDRIQSDFPLAAAPYARLAEQVGLSAEDARGAVMRLRRAGVIRRIGGSYVPARLGYVASLIAAEVVPDRVEEAAARASQFPSVTHNYQRDAKVNLWFTVIAPSKSHLQEVVGTVRAVAGVGEIHALPAIKNFKLRVDFAFGDSPRRVLQAAAPVSGCARPCALDALDRRLIARTCGDIGTAMAPYDGLAEELGLPRSALLERLQGYLDRGAMRRFGAILRHQRAGYVANGMAVWDVPDEAVEDAGAVVSARPEVTHCYERPRFPGWPYNLYAMIHGREAGQVRRLAEALAQRTGAKDSRTLFSVREFKKTSMVYFADGRPPQPCGGHQAPSPNDDG